MMILNVQKEYFAGVYMYLLSQILFSPLTQEINVFPPIEFIVVFFSSNDYVYDTFLCATLECEPCNSL